MRRAKTLPRTLVTAFLALSTTEVASAHDVLTPHSHPHADWSAALAALVVLGGVAALFAIPFYVKASTGKDRHDPR